MTRPVRTALAAARLITAALLAALALIPPEALDGVPPVCLFRTLFGFECLGCGMTRSLCRALHGEFETAVQTNRLVLLALPAMLACIAVPVRFWRPPGRRFRSAALRRRLP